MLQMLCNVFEYVIILDYNLITLDSNPTQANFLWLLLRILQWCISYVSVHSATLMRLTVQNFD